jgi:undecaprenyl diphosphate synthase
MSEANPSEQVPRHVAVIMDGNGRWAKKRRLGRVRGHLEGIASVRTIVKSAHDAGVRYLTLFAFSTENWRRPRKEVTALMQILSFRLNREIKGLVKQGVRIRAIGDRSRLPEKARKVIEKAEAQSADQTGMDLILALSYSGRDEILHAVRSMIEEGVDPAEVDEELFRRHLYEPDLPDPDLLIRTSGEQRISNFLLWQLAYTELYITDTLWPDFREEAFAEALDAYRNRTRRFGKTDDQMREK